MKIIFTIVFFAAAVVNYGQTPDTSHKPDNTKISQRDRNSSEATADQQKANATDQDLTKTIRQSIMADKSLSTYAHNIKIISQNGTVTMNSRLTVCRALLRRSPTQGYDETQKTA